MGINRETGDEYLIREGGMTSFCILFTYCFGGSLLVLVAIGSNVGLEGPTATTLSDESLFGEGDRWVVISLFILLGSFFDWYIFVVVVFVAIGCNDGGGTTSTLLDECLEGDGDRWVVIAL